MAEDALGSPPRSDGFRVAVLGSPIGHSLSPVLHSAAYAALGLTNWSFEAVECDQDGFGSWFAGLGPQWRGLSVTMPLKHVVFPFLAEVSPLARAVGAVNTVTWDDARRPIGHNTDVHGIVEALRSVTGRSVRSACILGSGATARSAIAGLAELGCTDVVLQVRFAPEADEALLVAERFGVRASVGRLDDKQVALDAEVVIATLPADVTADWARSLPAGRPAGVLLDVTYHPWPTVAVTAWTAAGGRALGGFELLLQQAAAQVPLMTGLPAPVEAMRVAGRQALS
jgi:shikimate-5-dehydrogenase